MTILALAAGGRGSRMGELGRKFAKPLIPDPIYHRPLLGHVLDRILAGFSISHILVVGSQETTTGNQVADYVSDYTRDHGYAGGVKTMLVSGEHRGVGFSLFLALKQVQEKRLPGDILFSVSDTLAETYSNLLPANPGIQAVVGVSSLPSDPKKVMTKVWQAGNGQVIFGPRPGPSLVLGGAYWIRAEILPFTLDLFAEKTSKKYEPKYHDREGNVRMTWLFQEMQARGLRLGLGDLGWIAELNYPEDLTVLGKLFCPKS